MDFSQIGGETASRRAALSAIGAGVAGLSGCLGGGDGGDGGDGATAGSPDSSAPFRNQTLRVSTWSGANATVFQEEIKPAYEEATGGTVEIVPGWSEILAKIRAAPADDPPYDLTVTGDRQHYLGLQSDLWEPIDVTGLDNAARIKEPLLREDPISVPVAYGVMCHAYDESAVEETPGPWADLLTSDEDVALPGAYWSNSMQMAAIASDEMPFDEELYGPDGHDAIFETLRTIDADKYYTGAQDLWTAIQEGVATTGQYFFAYSQKKSETADMQIGINVPTETTGYIDDYHAVRGTDRLDMATDFLDFLLTPEIQETYAESFNMGMATTDVEYPDATSESVPLTPAELEDVSFLEWSDLAEYSETLTERFNALKSE